MTEPKNPARLRLNRLIARFGICSRRKADELIVQGRVSIDGVVCREVGTEVEPSQQRISVDGQLLKKEPPRTYLMLHKPLNVVTTRSDPQNRRTVIDLLPKNLQNTGVFPVGRLDADSEGLLLLSNDGDWSQILLHPQHQVWKEYIVRTDAPIPPAIRSQLENGVWLDGKKTIPARVRPVGGADTHVVRFSIREGRNRQIRRMCLKFRIKVVSLQRVTMGPIHLGDLPVGHWRELTPKEVQSVLALEQEAAVTSPAPSRRPRQETRSKRPSPRDPQGSGGVARPGTKAKRPARPEKSTPWRKSEHKKHSAGPKNRSPK
ncbi:MAG: pseudouridine synthase [bacterium]|jgi:pseudouridine synthase|nr:pseudouridine synthase [bacterium]